MKWASEHKLTFTTKAYNVAVEAGNLEALDWLFNNNVPIKNDGIFMLIVVKSLNLKIIEWAVAKGCPLPVALCNDDFSLISKGKLEILQYFHKVGVVMQPELYNFCYKHHQVHIIQWLNDIGIEVPLQIYKHPVNINSEEKEIIFLHVIEKGDVESFKIFMKMEFPYDIEQVLTVVSPNFLKIMKSLGFPSCESYSVTAATQNNLSILRKLVQCGFPWNPEECLKLATDQRTRNWITRTSGIQLSPIT